MDAVIATNTTIGREGVEGMKHANEGGGLSGAPLKRKADQTLVELRKALPEEIDDSVQKIRCQSPNLMPCASGSSVEKLIVFVWRRM